MEHGAADLAYDICTGEFAKLLGIANFTLWVGVCAAIVISVLTVAERIAALVKKSVVREGSGGSAGVASFLDSLKGLIAALAAAPPWFAIFLAGVLLLWCAGKFTPTECRRSLTNVEQSSAEPVPEKGSNSKSKVGVDVH